MNGEDRTARGILVGKPQGKRPLGKRRRRWTDNIKMDFRENEWIQLAQERDQWKTLGNAVGNLGVP
jgi:hypothetical protein